MGCMSFGNYILTLVVILFMAIFFATAAIINQTVIKLRDQPASLPGISLKNASAYVTWGIVMGIIAAVIIVLIAVFSFLIKTASSGGSIKTPAGVIAVLVVGFLIFGVFSALFIGNSIFLAKMKSIIASDPAAIAVSANTVEVFYIINAILAAIATVVTVLALVGFILCLFPQTQRFIFALFGVGKPSLSALGVTSKKKGASTPTVNINLSEEIELEPLSSTSTLPVNSTSAAIATKPSSLTDLLNSTLQSGVITTPLGDFPIADLTSLM